MEFGKLLLTVTLGGICLMIAFATLCWISTIYAQWKESRQEHIRQAILRTLFCERERKAHEEVWVRLGTPVYPDDLRLFIESEVDARKNLARLCWLNPMMQFMERARIAELEQKKRQYNLV